MEWPYARDYKDNLLPYIILNVIIMIITMTLVILMIDFDGIVLVMSKMAGADVKFLIS